MLKFFGLYLAIPQNISQINKKFKYKYFFETMRLINKQLSSVL